MKHIKERGYDTRIRFGWCYDLDTNPQKITEKRQDWSQHPVAVVPMPFMSAKQKSKINKRLKGYVWPDV